MTNHMGMLAGAVLWIACAAGCAGDDEAAPAQPAADSSAAESQPAVDLDATEGELNLSFKLIPAKDIPTLFGPPVPEDENAFPIYQQAFEKMAALLERESEQDRFRALKDAWAIGGRSGVDGEGAAAETDRDPAAARAFLSDCAEVLALLDKAAAMPGFRCDADWSEGMEALLPFLMQMIDPVKLTLLDAAVSRSEGDRAAAWRDVLTVLRMANHVGQEPVMICQQVARYFRMLALAQLGRLLAESPPPEVMRSALHRVLDVDGMARLRACAIGQILLVNATALRAMDDPAHFRETVDSIADFREPAYRVPVDISDSAEELDAMRRAYLAHADRYVRACGRGRLAALKSDGLHIAALPQAAGQDANVFIALFPPDLSRWAAILFADESRRRMARLALDLAAWRQAHGVYPASLAALPEEALRDATLKTDIFAAAGAVLGYRRTDDGFLLWSVGPDGDDDDGAATEDAARSSDGDIVFRVPPVE